VTEAPRVRVLKTADVADLLDDVAGFPLGNAPMSGKASLAGVQEKVLLARVGEGWAQCLYGYPSTHILKPVSRPHSDMIYNEEYASRLARALGLAPYATWIESFEGTDALMIERYDRDDAVPGGRLHQEDFNQVLGASGAEKYQEHAGKVSLGRIATVVSSAQGGDGLEQLLTLVTLAVAVGNLDMHAKNISLLHLPDGSARLAPAYDMVPLTHYPGIDGRMAMSINDLYEHSRIGRGDLVAEAGRWGVGHARAEEVLDQTLATIRAALHAEIPHVRATPGLADQIRTQVRGLVASE
jgi:serine/threonine-protein kinase HipA